jgi:hypothetical protein
MKECKLFPLKKFLILLIIQIGLYAQAWNSQSSCNNLKVSSARNPYLIGRLGTVDLLVKIVLLKRNMYIFSIKSNWSKEVSTKRSNVLTNHDQIWNAQLNITASADFWEMSWEILTIILTVSVHYPVGEHHVLGPSFAVNCSPYSGNPFWRGFQGSSRSVRIPWIGVTLTA